MSDASVPGKRRRGRQKTRPWKYLYNRDMESIELTVEDVMDRTKRKTEIENYSGNTDDGENTRRKL